MHSIRLRNAEHRSELEKAKRSNQMLSRENREMKLRLQVLEKEKAQDGAYILKQDQELEKLLENKLNNVALIKGKPY